MMSSLKQAVRIYLAWKSIKDDSEDLNLDAAQNRETDNNLKRSNETVDSRIKEAYCWLLVPYIDKSQDMKTIVWDSIRISGGNDSIITKASKKMLQNEAIITQWAPALLLMELDNVLWQDSENISIKKLWEYLCTYCYLPRLANEQVLEDAIRNGINSSEYFAYASGFDGARYIDLKLNQYIGIVERSGVLVKFNVAQKQVDDEAAKRQTVTPTGGTSLPSNDGPSIVYPNNDNGNTGGSTAQETPDPEPIKNKHFFMSAQLDNTRIGRDVQRLVEEVINHLTSVDGAQVEVSLELNVTAPDGMSPQTIRTVSENCRTLRVKSFGFDD
jgi:hypothetical protein